MRTDRAVTRMRSDRVAMRPIVDRMTDDCKNITFPSVGKILVVRTKTILQEKIQIREIIEHA